MAITKTITVNFINGTERTIKAADVKFHNEMPFLVFIEPGGAEVHINISQIQSMDFPALATTTPELIMPVN